MSRACLCDVCGNLAVVKDVVRLDVDLPKEDDPDTSTGWSGVDVCRACWSKPLIEVLSTGCNDFPVPEEGGS